MKTKANAVIPVYFNGELVNVEVDVNLTMLALRLGRKALNNKTGVARAVGGAIQIKIKRT